MAGKQDVLQKSIICVSPKISPLRLFSCKCTHVSRYSAAKKVGATHKNVGATTNKLPDIKARKTTGRQKVGGYKQ